MSEQGDALYSPETGVALLKKELKAGHSIRHLNGT
jgi:hypothetical protein